MKQPVPRKCLHYFFLFYGFCHYQRTSLCESRLNPTKAKLVLLKKLVLEKNRIKPKDYEAKYIDNANEMHTVQL